MRRLAPLLLGVALACSAPQSPDGAGRAPVGPASSASDGSIIPLGHVGGASSQGWAIGGTGKVLALGVNSCCAFVWDAGSVTSIGANAAFRDINDAGVVVGAAVTPSGPFHGFTLLNGVTTDLGALTPTGNSDASAINNTGKIAGSATAATGHSDAVVWASGQIQDIVGYPDRDVTVTDINDAGVVVGYTQQNFNFFSTRSFIWSPTSGLLELDLPPNAQTVQLEAINNAGVAVGFAQQLSGPSRHAVLWSAATGWVDLATASGTDQALSEAHDINNAGLVAGETSGLPGGACAGAGNGNPCAAVWLADHSVAILPAPPGALAAQGYYAWGVNDAGQVIGTAAYGPNAPSSHLEATLWQSATGGGAPTASTNGPYAGDEGVLLTFDATTSTDPDGDPLTYTWSFGDGSPLVQGAVVTHAFPDNAAAPYPVLLTARDPAGHSSTVRTVATIANLPPAVSLAAVDSVTATVATPLLGSFADSGAADGPYVVKYLWGDGTPADSFVQSTEGALTRTHTYGAVGSYTLIVTVRDKDLATGADTIPVLVVPANRAPVASAGGPYGGTEGIAVGFDGSLSRDLDNDPLSYAWDFGDGSTGTGVAPTHVYLKSGSFTASVVVSDGRGLSGSATAAVSISNVAPTASAGPDFTVPIGAVAGPPFDFSDPGTAGGPWQVVIDFGNGGITSGSYAAPGPIHTGTIYTQAGTYRVTITVTDLAGSIGADTAFVTVSGNQPPVANAGGPYTGNEGAAIQLLGGQSSDPNNDPLTYAWKFGDGGTSALANPTHVYTDNGTFTITLTVRDPKGLTNSTTTTATIANVPPTATFTKPASVNEGAAFTISLTGATDVSAPDRAAGFQFAFDCGAGFGAFGAATSRACPAQPDNGTVTVSGQVRDKNGGIRTYSAAIPVKNVAPTVTITAGGPTTFPSGTTFTLNGKFTDPGSLDAPWSYSIAWGDGTAASTGTATRGTSFPVTHLYNRKGTWTVRMTVTDKNGGKGTSGALTIRVQ